MEPLTIVQITSKSSFIKTKSASAPCSIRPFYGKPSKSAGVFVAILTASYTDIPD
jgi:hypothetical protein